MVLWEKLTYGWASFRGADHANWDGELLRADK